MATSIVATVMNLAVEPNDAKRIKSTNKLGDVVEEVNQKRMDNSVNCHFKKNLYGNFSSSKIERFIIKLRFNLNFLIKSRDVMPLSWIINMNAYNIMLQVLAAESCM